MSTLPVTALGPPGAGTEQRPRLLLQPDASPDSKQAELKASGKLTTSASFSTPYSKPHGNSLPQEPSFHRSWSMDKKTLHLVQHPHQKPWTSSTCPGKFESPEGVNQFHRVWLTDTSTRGRWNKARKEAFYAKQDSELMAKIPHDQKFSKSDSNYKFWTHLKDGGVKAGGQDEKLDYTYQGPNRTSAHFYVGKFENVRHVQRILKTGFKDAETGESRELHRDTRSAFDNRLHDDMVRYDDECTRSSVQANLDCFRPRNTWSLPQLGADYVK